ncbi:ABC transporter permease [Bifidobacterium subtile]|jgi:osmoprotectant transport system permease protein|uniref:ABC-type proline/glycine betaine transport system, permease component n=1 Tax=Bifidobacterium subtile TaxID=77635 RepID=A0A087E7Q7_9BIFI|nr:ABC transporter permease [Bifidobacterium subtile]KFJ03808.1 ABC-type proline/glycine betaine transport system, permease component [Bifidobacterium subtile]MCI1242040.1 ABC transporter permease [Bifidobacterium subtile]QOL36127.1 ABC transporter permease [Bifidobacterium subtile]
MKFTWILDNLPMIGELTISHLFYTLLPTVIGLVVSIPLGGVAYRYRRLYGVIVNISSVLYTVPSLALFVLLPKILGTRILDPLNVVIALTVYSVALMVREVADGLASVPHEVLDAAEGMGLTSMQRFFRVELPVALPVLFGALRVVVVSNISIVTVAALVGISQLGSLFTIGFSRRTFVPIVAGLVMCLVLALVLDRLIAALGKAVTPWRERNMA